jgi:acyl-CoA reductase-like NAD-dependent aldehyde dehydrogenase
MKVMREETFGPVAPIMTFSGVEQGLNFANDTIYGLVAYLYTKDLAKALKVSEDLQYGTIGINNVSGGEIGYPYGGWKQSGIGIEFSEAALYEYLCIKHVRIKL